MMQEGVWNGEANGEGILTYTLGGSRLKATFNLSPVVN